MKTAASEGLNERQKAKIEALATLPDEEFDTSDIPEILDWSGVVRGALYRQAGNGQRRSGK